VVRSARERARGETCLGMILDVEPGRAANGAGNIGALSRELAGVDVKRDRAACRVRRIELRVEGKVGKVALDGRAVPGGDELDSPGAGLGLPGGGRGPGGNRGGQKNECKQFHE